MFEFLMSLAKAFEEKLVSKKMRDDLSRCGVTHVVVREFEDGRQVVVGTAH